MSTSCERVNELLPEYFEGDLRADQRAAVEAHARECPRCATVLREVETIRREAASLPLMAPSRDLWSGIEQRISAEVIPLESAQSRVMRHFSARNWMAAAAAALVVTTAGITYIVTSRASIPNSASSPVASQTRVTAPVDASTGTEASATQPTEPTPANLPPNAERETRHLASSGSERGRTGSEATGYPGSMQADAAYSHEIRILESMVTDRSSQLDSGTVQIIKRNLQIIDAAIAQSKAALARDPASRLLYDQLNHVLDKKVELLRTAVMLPSST